MRTKTLLIAVAALAAAVTSSHAQTTVYSQNIVGYVNLTLPAGQYSWLVNPLTNSAASADVVMPALESGDTLYIWSPVQNAYYSTTFYGTNNTGVPGQAWLDQFGNVTNGPSLNPGEGIVYQNNQSAAETNTFTGTVLLNNSITLGASYYTAVGSTPPIGGSLDDTNFNLPLQSGDTIYVWNSGANNFYSSTFYGTNNTGVPGQAWLDQFGNVTNGPVVNVGQSFFYQNNQSSSEIWNQNLVIQ